jgi:hypothetical protein
MDRDDVAELEALISVEGNESSIILDLNDLTLVGQDAITFLDKCEVDGIALKNCARYIREWITRQRGGS